MNLPSIPLLVLDTETTGFVPRVNRVIEFACMRVEKGNITDTYEQLIGIDGEIPPHVEVLTQIQTADLQGKPRFENMLPTIEKFLTPDTIIVGQNIGFDLRMLKGEGWDLTAHPWIDTSMLASIVFPELHSYSLGYLSTVLTLNHEPRHRALGDVRATLELLEKCCERLGELPPAALEELQQFAKRGPQGYREFFTALTSTGKKKPVWLKRERKPTYALPKEKPMALSDIRLGTVELLEESLDPHCLGAVIRALQEKKGAHVVAVKNLEATIRRFDLKDIAIIYPPEFLPDSTSKKRFLAQETYITDELTLAMKLALYEPKVRSEVPVHGDEYAVWSGKLACNRESKNYTTQLSDLKGVAVIDHQELLRLIDMETSLLPESVHIVIDDASMLEDTATQAYGWTCSLSSLRAGAQGQPLLTKLADLLELWVEKTRSGTDLRYITDYDLQTAEAEGLREQLDNVLATNPDTQAKAQIEQMKLIMMPENLAGRFAWIENFIDTRTVKSAPDNVAQLLREKLYDRYATSLIIPSGSANNLPAILDPHRPPQTVTLSESDSSLQCKADIQFPIAKTMDAILSTREGKTVLLMGSKRSIEDLYVKHFERLEKEGVTLLCQGLAGGQGRMQAEFSAAAAPAILVTTPWTYETYELPPDTVDRLIVQTLPFDHPSHPIVSRRSQHFKDPFGEYCIPRLKHRLFRLMRTFCKHRTGNATVEFLDDRIRTKAYGKDVTAYLETLAEVNPLKKAGERQMKLL